MTRILFVTSEIYPLIKTGGLADVAASLPAAIKKKRHDIRILLPAYHEVLKTIPQLAMAPLTMVITTLTGYDFPVRILESKLPGTTIKLWLLDAPTLFDRPGNPYVDHQGHDWPDNAQRFGTLCKVACQIARDEVDLDWQPDIVHCNDWQTGLIPALLAKDKSRPSTIFTIHNLAYQGVFPKATFKKLDLPAVLWSMHGLEFYGSLSFIKGGLVYADMVNTVSPNYAREICTEKYGHGLEGLLKSRQARLRGIINGVDYDLWNPETDPHLIKNYSADKLSAKASNKTALQLALGLSTKTPTRTTGNRQTLIGMVGRLVTQKGIDLVLKTLSRILSQNVQLVILGSGDKKFESALKKAQKRFPGQLTVHIGYDEELAHRIEAASDIFLMPSRFEPCGLNQIYSLRYGTLPVVHNTGGLADTVVDASTVNIKAGTATGFIFNKPQTSALLETLHYAIHLHQKKPKIWRQMMVAAMNQRFHWKDSAHEYLKMYKIAHSYNKTSKKELR